MNVYNRVAHPEPGNEVCNEKSVKDMETQILSRRGYTLNGVLGEGTYSKVKRAWSTKLNRNVAIKIINKDEAPRRFRDLFLPREIKILKRLRHPRIIQTYDMFETSSPQNKVYIVTEAVDSGDLLDRIKLDGAMSEGTSRFIATDVCRAVAYLHRGGICHRDIKCENIILNKALSPHRHPCHLYNAKLCDLGFARDFLRGRKPEIPGSRVYFITNTFCGSAAYASPEILERKSHDAIAADVWAMGVVFFIMLHGSMPYDDSDIKQMVVEQKKGNVLDNDLVDLTRSAVDFMAMTLVPEPSKRCSVFQLLQHKWLNAATR